VEADRGVDGALGTGVGTLDVVGGGRAGVLEAETGVALALAATCLAAASLAL
jgi:hypothetical protein